MHIMQSSTTFFAVLCLISVHVIQDVKSHGRLMNPPARNSMWRFGYPNPVNYNDNELFCGGLGVQTSNGGKCGICGDNYAQPSPRMHEIGGIYANSIITRTYYAGQDINVEVELTSNHRGDFEFKLCPATDGSTEVTQECLNLNHAKVLSEDGSTTDKYVIIDHEKRGTFNIKLRLPQGLDCNRCVLQWTYRTGNTWGNCGDGTSQMGCGPQETFVNCADVRILSQNSMRDWVNPKFTSSSRSNPHMMYYRDFSRDGAPLTPLVIRNQVCVATKWFSETPGMDDWCQASCMRYPPYCPPKMCRCVEDCEAVGDFKLLMGSDQWCLDECSVYPPRNCTADRCACV